MPDIVITIKDEIASPIGKLKVGDKIEYGGSSSNDKHCYNFFHNGKRIENRNNLLDKTLWAIEKFKKMKSMIKTFG